MREIFVHERAGNGLSRIQFRTVPSLPEYNGRTMADLARDRGMPNSVEAGIELAIDLQLDGGFTAIYHAVSEDDLRRIMAHEQAMVCTDGDPVAFGRGRTGPDGATPTRAATVPSRGCWAATSGLRACWSWRRRCEG